jgi:hypothetical protein
MYEERVAEDGGLISYGPNVAEMTRRGASFIVKISQWGEARRLTDRATDKTRARHQSQNCEDARSRPPTVLTRADEVIE